MRRAGSILAACALLLAGCATDGPEEKSERPREGQERSVDKPPAPPRNEKTVRFGKVDTVRPVTLPGTDSGVGAVVGAVAGGVAGAEVGKGRGSAAGAVIGAAIGSLAGSALEGELTKREALEIIVELDTGELRAIVQAPEAGSFQPGDRVRLLTGGGVTRVEKLEKN